MGGLNDEIQKLGMLIAQKLYPGYSISAVSEILAGNLYVTPPVLERVDIAIPKKKRIPILYGSARNTEDSVISGFSDKLDTFATALLSSIDASYPQARIKKIEAGKEPNWFGVYFILSLEDKSWVKVRVDEYLVSHPRELVCNVIKEVDSWHLEKFGWKWHEGKRVGPLVDALEVVTGFFKSITKAIEAAAEDPSLSRFQQIEWK